MIAPNSPTVPSSSSSTKSEEKSTVPPERQLIEGVGDGRHSLRLAPPHLGGIRASLPRARTAHRPPESHQTEPGETSFLAVMRAAPGIVEEAEGEGEGEGGRSSDDDATVAAVAVVRTAIGVDDALSVALLFHSGAAHIVGAVIESARAFCSDGEHTSETQSIDWSPEELMSSAGHASKVYAWVMDEEGELLRFLFIAHWTTMGLVGVACPLQIFTL